LHNEDNTAKTALEYPILFRQLKLPQIYNAKIISLNYLTPLHQKLYDMQSSSLMLLEFFPLMHNPCRDLLLSPLLSSSELFASDKDPSSFASRRQERTWIEA
jgi:hypothetical protein